MLLRHTRCRWLTAIAAAVPGALATALGHPATLSAQTFAPIASRAQLVLAPGTSTMKPDTMALDSLIARALAANPGLAAARARARAAESRVAPAGARPDPMLMAGVQNFPVSEPGFGDFMTMKMLGVSQTIPAPGRLASGRRAAVYEVEAALAQAAEEALAVERDVRSAYYEVAYIDQTLAIVERTREVLVSLIAATEVRYTVGAAGQEEVLRARVEVAKLGQEAVMLHENRRAAVARMNALVDAETSALLTSADIPAKIRRAAGAETPGAIGFVSPTLGSRASGSPVPPLDSLLAVAVRHSPVLRMQEATIAAQGARAELARLERRPDVDVSLQYGQRDGFSDMVTATISVPLPLQRGRRQDPLAAAARGELLALEAERHQRRNALRADVTRLHTEIERARTQLALLVKGVLPQSRAGLEAAVASYQSGGTDFITVLDAQATLFNSETAWFRGLADFATRLAELKAVVGAEILP